MLNNNVIVSVIPARGGSKTIPMKNIQLLNGKYLIDYTIEYSLMCPLINRTVVSTDSKKIAKIAINSGAEVPFMRPKSIAKDHTPDFPVIKHALLKLEKIYDEIIDVVVLLRPTSPLRPKNLIDKGLDLLNKNKLATSIRTVKTSTENPYRQWIKKDKYIFGYENEKDEPYNIPRQKIPITYFQTGDLEIIRRKTLIDGSVSGEKVLPLYIDNEIICDIDKKDDLKKAEEIIRSQNFE